MSSSDELVQVCWLTIFLLWTGGCDRTFVIKEKSCGDLFLSPSRDERSPLLIP
ncbi:MULTISPECIES: hypothetical protein [Planktothricoides]|uniref:Uncharacterized protein n=2 Tax=Planktothricoides raciborskii TaxID=132608 RepID=A0AAU8JK45_9CYAN|nr:MULTISPECIES: hypothetical protein [Planktothricoides]MBD2547649.1 hypothetical protein [Planktothricoides raciborskii FACHB-1370]MBD2586088.1 hypothetical protein [Planktothricoides raciborskii FACHB-1261]